MKNQLIHIFKTFVLIFLNFSMHAQEAKLEWAKKLGGTSIDHGLAICIDNNGNVYTVGQFEGTSDFNPGSNTNNLSSAGNRDVFVSKLDKAGNYVWAKRIGGKYRETGFTLAIDRNNNLYIGGSFQDTADFDPGTNSFNMVSAGSDDGFILKLDSLGDFIWAKQFSGTGLNRVIGLTVDKTGNVFSTGEFTGTADFDPNSGTFNMSSTGTRSVFVSKLNSNGQFVWAKKLGGGSDYGTTIRIDSSGNVITCGILVGTSDYDPGSGTFNLTSAGDLDVFISKLDTSGNFVWAKRVGGISRDAVSSLFIDPQENLYLTGYFYDTVDFDPGSGNYNLASKGNQDIYILKLDKLGEFKWAKSMGSAGWDWSRGIVLDEQKNVYVTGYFHNTVDFDPGADTFLLSSRGSSDIFILKLDSSGNFNWAKQMGGTSVDRGNDIVIDKKGTLHSVGEFGSTADFDPGINTFNLSSSGNFDVYIHKMFQCGHTYDSINVNVCDRYVSPSTKFTWTNTGVYRDTLVNNSGCDSIITINLTVKKSSTSTINKIVCDSLISPSGKYKWFNSGNYKDTTANSAGCDSIITVNLTVNSSSNSSINRVVCDSLKSPSGNFIWKNSGTFYDTILNSFNCDSFITINLTVNKSVNSSVHIISCDYFNSPSSKYRWDSSGTYYDTIQTSTGCDSFITINLTIKNSSKSTQNLIVCDSLISPSLKYIWINTGTYYDTLTNTIGCDSIITFNLTVNKRSYRSLIVTNCDSFISPSTKYVWKTSGVYHDTITNSMGCDSIIAINLTVNYASSSTINPIACNLYLSPSGNFVWSSSGSYKDTIANSMGCDSIITINLTVNYASSSTINPIACNSYLSPSGNFTWTNSGSYKDTLVNFVGCDSIITINLTVNYSSNSTINPVVCNSYLSPSRNYVWTNSGSYNDTIANSVGCDSIITINLTVNYASSSIINPVACNSYLSPSGNFIWTNSGSYIDTIANSMGCDSIIVINLTVVKSSFASFNWTVCDSIISPSGKYIWRNSGNYIDTIINSQNCDSILTINLNINKTTGELLSINACNYYTSPSGKLLTISGVYFDTLNNVSGCDSLIIIDLTVTKIDTAITNEGAKLTSVESDAFYQWLNCNNNKEPIIGETNQSFTATIIGSYAVEITQNGCKDTSICYLIDNVRVPSNLFKSGITFYPNPFNNNIILQSDLILSNAYLKIISMEGKLVFEKSNLSGKEFNFELNSFAEGVYYMELNEGNRIVRFKIIKLR